MADSQVGLAKFGFKNSIDVNDKSVRNTEKRKASKLSYAETKIIRTFVPSWTERFPGIADLDRGLICTIYRDGETEISNLGTKSFIDGCTESTPCDPTGNLRSRTYKKLAA